MQRRTTLAVIFFSLSGLAWGGSLDQAKQLIAAGQPQNALVQVDSILADQSNDYEALFLRAVILSKLNRPQEAIELYTQLIEQQPTLPEPRNNLAAIYAEQGKYLDAEETLQGAINTHPSYATAHNNLSSIYKALASIAYNKALNLDNGNQPKAIPETNLTLITELHSHQAKTEERPPATEAEKTTETSPATPQQSTPKIDSEIEKPVDINDIESTIGTWAKAWSAQNVDDYLNHYSTDFTPDDGLSYEAWVEQRQQRLKAPAHIEVKVSQLHTTVLNNQVASVSFRQAYRSDRFGETTRKVMLLQLEDGQWRIVQELETK